MIMVSRNWGEEALRLRSVFTAGSGKVVSTGLGFNPFFSAYTMGPMDRDCWHVFCMDSRSRGGGHPPEQKLEIMMTDLDQEKMMVFHQSVSNDGLDARKVRHSLPLYLYFLWQWLCSLHLNEKDVMVISPH